MRVVVASPYLAPAWAFGGPPRLLRSLCRELAALPEWTVSAITSTALDRHADLPAGSDLSDGTPTLRVPRVRAGWPTSYFRMPALGPALRRALAVCDCALLHGIWTDVDRVGRRECERAGVPYLVYTHGVFTPWALAHHGARKKIYFALAERGVLAGAAGIVTSNELEEGELRVRGISTPVRRIPGGIDPPMELRVDATPALRSRIAERPFVLCMGRLDPQKGLDVLIDAFAASLASEGYALVLAGADFVGDGARLEARAASRGIADRVIFPGLVDGDDREWLLQRAALYAQISRSEGTSVAVLEALARGLPTILSVGAAFPELDGSSAAVVVPLDQDAIAEGLRAAARGPLGAGTNAAGAALARERFSWPAIARRTADYIEECVR